MQSDAHAKLALKSIILPHFFAFVFYIDFSSIFSRFRKGFGRDLGGPSGPKIEILGAFLDMLFETLILIEFLCFFDETDSETYIDFLLFSVLFLVFFLTLETLKIVLPSRRELNFYKIVFFAVDEKRRRK